MVRAFPRAEKPSIEFDEFLDKMDAMEADFLSEDNFPNTLDLFQRLYANRTFIAQAVNQYLDDLGQQADNPYTGQVIMLANRKHYLVRAPIWVPSNSLVNDRMYAYGQAHDHDFDLLTIGYLGNGYRTETYQYDFDATSGEIGEQVEIKNKEIYRLTEGSAIFLKANQDIHVQYPPEEICMSLNLIQTSNKSNKQYLFDLEKSEITQHVNSTVVETFKDIAAIVGNDETFQILNSDQ